MRDFLPGPSRRGEPRRSMLIVAVSFTALLIAAVVLLVLIAVHAGGARSASMDGCGNCPSSTGSATPSGS